MAKKRAEKYEEKVVINKSFEGIVKAMLKDPKKAAKKAANKAKAKK